MAWIESHQELRNSPKTIKLARLLGVSRFEAIGVLHCLWWWVFDYAKDGDISRIESVDLACGLGWAGDPDAFKAALVSSGFLDLQDGRCLVHDWAQYGGKSAVKLEEGRERVRKYRQRKSAQETTSVFDGPNLFGESTTPPCNALHRVTNAITEHEQNMDYSSSSSRAHARGPVCSDKADPEGWAEATRVLTNVALPAFESSWPELPKVPYPTSDMIFGVYSILSKIPESKTPYFWQKAAAKAKSSPFLQGIEPGADGKRWKGMSANWFFQPDTVAKVIAGLYDQRQTDAAFGAELKNNAKRRRKCGSSTASAVSGYSSANTVYPDRVERL